MKLGIVTTMSGNSWGGSEELWHATAIAARSRGHEVMVSAHPDQAGSERLSSAKSQGLSVVPRTPHGALESLSRSVKGRLKSALQGKRLLWRVAEAIRLSDSRWKDFFRFDPDVLLINCAGNNDLGKLEVTVPLEDWLHSNKKPYVLLTHGDVEQTLPWDGLRRRLIKNLSGAFKIGYGTDYDKELMERLICRPIVNSFRLFNPVNLTDTSIVPWKESAEARFAFVGRLDVEHKGLDLLVQSLGTDVWRARHWRLQIFGKGPGEDFIQRLIEFYRLADKVEFLGQASDIRKVWTENQLLLLTSRRESFPLVIVEAMLCGRLCLVTDVGGSADWIEEGVTGFVAAGSNVNAIRRALEVAWEARDRWEQMGRRAHDAVLERKAPDPAGSMLKLLEEAYQSSIKP